MLELFFSDLNLEAQGRVLEFYGYKTAQDGNLDIIPLAIFEKPIEEGE